MLNQICNTSVQKLKGSEYFMKPLYQNVYLLLTVAATELQQTEEPLLLKSVTEWLTVMEVIGVLR